MARAQFSFLTQASDRSIALDVLRLLAVFLVLGNHMYVCPENISPSLHWLTSTWRRGGWIGVDLFFVLSGFLISGLLFKEAQMEGRISLKRFFIRRGLKIYPPFWVLILFTIGLEVSYRIPLDWRWMVSELLFVQNYGRACQWGYTWSLAVEEHFYIVLPVLLVLLLRLASRKDQAFRAIPSLFGVVALGCLGLRLLAAQSGEFSMKSRMLPTHLRFDSLFFGVLLSYYCRYHPHAFQDFGRRHSRLLILGGGLLLAPAFAFERGTIPYVSTWGLSQFYLGSGLLLMGFLGRQAAPGPFGRLLAFVGSRSYSLYLWHGPVAWLASERFRPSADFLNWYGWTVTYLGGALLVGLLMAAAVEYPILRLRDRFVPSRTGPAVEPPPFAGPGAPARAAAPRFGASLPAASAGS